VDGLYLSVIQKINQSKAYTVSVDIPSGMRAENSMEGVVIKADWTITFEQPKISMLMTDNVDFVGALSVAPIGISSACKTQQKTNNYYIEATSVYRLLQPKARSVHKYQRGVGLLIAGSINMPGALQLSATAAMRSGMGMLYIHTNKEVFDTLSNQLPEALYVNELNTDAFQPILKKINAIAIGPGMELGNHSLQLLEQVLLLKNQNIVLDATALGLLNKVSNWEEKIKVSSCILTPHQGEFDQLFGKQKNDWERLQTAIAKAQTLNCVIVLKGPHTAICMPNGNCYFNSTGNQGMAKAGSGDVLTGIILSLLAQKYNREEATLIGVYMHGWVGDSAAEKVGMESMIASDIILSIPLFYKNQNLYS
jgi:NAD(P)H-hydrate epimerase